MKLDRDISPNGTGKYALLNLRRNRVEWGRPGEEDEFFVIKLRDIHSKAALLAYAESAEISDPEYALAVRELASRAGIDSPFCKVPD